MGWKRDSNPFNGPKWENCCNRDLFRPSQSQLFCEKRSPLIYYVINKSHVLAYSVGFRINPVDWLEGNRRIQQLSVVKILSDLRRTIEMLTARICMDFVWTPRLLFVTLLASLDYRSVTEAKYLWGLCMSVTSVCFTPVCLLNYDRLEAIL